jgi:hypothetical protein
VLPACEPIPPDALVVATSWPEADRSRVEEGFAGWLEAEGHGPVRIDWWILSPVDDLEGLASRRRPPDVLLGGPARSYHRLARVNRLSPLPMDGSPAWAVSRAATIGPVSATVPGDRTPAVAFDDPRNDPVSLAWAAGQLADGRFAEGYARLIRAAAARRRIGRRPGSASAALDRGEIDLAVGVLPADAAARDSRSVPWIEGVAIVEGGRHRDLAMLFIQSLAGTGHAGPIPPGPGPAMADDHELLADLLGATLVDAQDELWTAWGALEQAGSPTSQQRWMTEPPPWPPASIAKILERQGDQAMAMVETLAGQVATDPAARAWLITSWLSPSRLIDRGVLGELVRAADGRLIREPRFREWLRAEWTAWARQRYRRVSRALEAGHRPNSTGASPAPHPASENS